MAVVTWPPPTPPNTRTNDTAQLDAHPLDHNRIANALDTIIAQLGTGIPLLRYGTVKPTWASGSATWTLNGAAGTPLAPFPTAMDGVLAMFHGGAMGAGGSAINAVYPSAAQTFTVRCTSGTQAGALDIWFFAWGH